jgi:hypothetical protein
MVEFIGYVNKIPWLESSHAQWYNDDQDADRKELFQRGQAQTDDQSVITSSEVSIFALRNNKQLNCSPELRGIFSSGMTRSTTGTNCHH